MERFFFNTGMVSVFIGREAQSDWGAKRSGDTLEVWAGKTYACVDFSGRHIRRAGRRASFFAFVFCVGLILDPPAFAETAVHAVQDVVIWMSPDSPM